MIVSEYWNWKRMKSFVWTFVFIFLLRETESQKGSALGIENSFELSKHQNSGLFSPVS